MPAATSYEQSLTKSEERRRRAASGEPPPRRGRSQTPHRGQ